MLSKIDCNDEDCFSRYIDGSLAGSLTVDCGGSSCDGSHFICPVGVGSNCTVDCSEGTCNYALVQNEAGGVMDSFSLFCTHSTSISCRYIAVELTPQSIADIHIVCGRNV